MDKGGLCHIFRRLEGHCEVSAMANYYEKETGMKITNAKETR